MLILIVKLVMLILIVIKVFWLSFIECIINDELFFFFVLFVNFSLFLLKLVFNCGRREVVKEGVVDVEDNIRFIL